MKRSKLLKNATWIVGTVVLFLCSPIDFDLDEGDNYPTIRLLGPVPYTMNIGDTYHDPGAVIVDVEDGDLTDKVLIDNSDIDELSAGDYTVTYTVTDNDSNTSVRVRKVIVQESDIMDSEKPVITLLGDNPLYLAVGASYVDPGATAVDDQDGLISFDIQKFDTTFSTETADTHLVYYVVSDNAGNIAMTIRTVIVKEGLDIVPPVITIIGPNPVNLLVHYAYDDKGATATDNVDGDLTSQISAVSDVDTSKAGVYSVKYSVSDAAGNLAEKTRTVNIDDVLDIIKPVITLKGDNPLTMYVDSHYVEPGATATDNKDGDISSKIVVDTTQLNTSTQGNYTVHYSVKDNAGNEGTAERTINVIPLNFVDTFPPIISIKPPNPLNLGTGYKYIEYGATAYDSVDGDVSKNITVDTTGLNTNVSGDYNIYYRVSDKAGNDAEAIRVVKVTGAGDTTPPVISLKGTNPMSVEIHKVYSEPGATATDNFDGDISSKIDITGTVDTSKTGTYTRTYTVSDNAGNKDTKTRTVNVVTVIDNVKPVITLLGKNPDTVVVHNAYSDPGATATDNVDGTITSKIVKTGTVDTSKVGTNNLTYMVADNAGNTDTKTRTVRVVTSLVPEWKVGVAYKVNDQVTYNGKVYKCITAHTSQADWYPGAPGVYFWQLVSKNGQRK